MHLNKRALQTTAEPFCVYGGDNGFEYKKVNTHCHGVTVRVMLAIIKFDSPVE